MRNWIYCIALCILSFTMFGQMNINGEVLFGNEWIDYNKNYVKITVEEDGIYKVSYQELLAMGLPPGAVGAKIQVHHMGEQIATVISSEGSWGNNDYILFYGAKNDGEMDKHHYDNWVKDQLNPELSGYSDESNYFLSWGNPDASAKRYEQLDNDLSGSLPIVKKSFNHYETQVYSDKYWGPFAPEDKDVTYSTFKRTEGFATQLKSQHELELEVKNLTNLGPRAQLTYRMGTNNADHNILIYFNGDLVSTEARSGYSIIDTTIELPLSSLKNICEVEFEGTRPSDLYNVAYLTLRYPREFKADGQNNFKYTLNASSVNNYIELEQFQGGAQNYAFDVTNNRILTPQMEGTTAKMLFSTSGPNVSDVYVISEDAFKAPKNIQQVSFTSFDDLNPEFLILTSERLNKVENGVNQVEKYAEFRESELGGGYKTAAINVEDIYDQFGYGITGHSYSIKNFSNYIQSKWPEFKFAFIVGKALDYSNKNKQTLIESFVPTYGKPGSDNYLFCEGTVTYPYVAVGRLAAQNTTQIADYLDKVRVHAQLSDVENLTIEERIWRKNVLHLSGGDPATQTLLFNYLNSMGDTIQGNQYAGNVTTFEKTSSDPVQTTLSQQIIDVINKGVSITTFFGHSSAGTLDFSVEDPAEYSNYGKLPLFLAMGCKAGDIHSNVESLSEKMVLTKDLGAVAFIASSGNAYITPLAEMGTEFYKLMGTEFYGEPFGLAFRELLERQYRANNYQYLTLQEQNIIHGDPAIVLFTAPGPDYVVDFKTITTGDEEVGAYQEFINLEFDIVNLGRGIEAADLTNYVIHEYGNGKADTVYFNSSATFNRESISVQLDNPGFSGIGKNTIRIVLDVENEVEEFPAPMAEDNNDLAVAYGNEGYCFYVFDNSAFPIYPINFAIVHEPDISLKASASNAFADEQTYVVEIDTTELFNSSLKETAEIVSSPGIIDWNPNIEFQNNTVYYWRIIPKDVENTIWNTSSFIYLEGSSDGWNQSHFYQWIKDDYDTYSMDSTSRNFEFADNIADIRIINFEYTTLGVNPQVVILNDPQEYLEFIGDGNIKSGVYISVIDGKTGLPWINQPSLDLYGSVVGSSWAHDRYYFPYWTRTPEERDLVMTLIEDIVPDGHYITIFTVQRADVSLDFDYQPEEWASDAGVLGRDLMSVLESHGAQRVRELESGAVPYIFAYRKGDPSFTPIEVKAASKTDKIDTEFKILGKWPEGQVFSRTIGPATEWDRLQWNIDQIDFTQDSTILNVIGVKADGTEDILFANVEEFDFDLSSIDASVYPNLKLNFYASDDQGRTSAQMEYWRVLYVELPEAVLNTTEKFVFNSDTLTLGESLRLNTLATNITDTDMDSLLVKYTIVDEANSEVVQFNTVAPLKAFSSVDIDFEYPTTDLSGLHQFIVEINPEKAQREQFDFNNIGILDFTVTGDNINPILDVTFDGMHIMDGDIVSPTPHICITLRDESEQFYIDNIENFELAMQALPDQQAYPIDLTTATNVVFTPADSTTGYAKLEFSPELTSGEYVLFAQGSDKSGNLSGDQGIEVKFTVIEEAMISNVLNYPNPFSTSTQFVFTLTGNDVPDVFTIQIMTMSGKIVKEITKEEMGNIRVGVNRTDYKWNGTDEFGNKLANGVYIYRVLTSHADGEVMEHFNNESVDSFFNKGFGKLVIMR